MAAWVKKSRSVMGAVSIVAVGFFIWFLWPTGETVADFLQPFGYLEIVPPSNFHGPGTINTIEIISDKRIKLHPTCEMDTQILTHLTRTSNTVDRDLVQKLSKSFNISAQIKKIISLEIAEDQAKDIFISLKDVKILNISDEALHKLQRQFVKDDCQEAIAFNLRNGGVVCQTQAAIEADVVYKILYKENVSVSEQGKLTKNIASKFNIEAGQDTVDEVIGKRLFYGVKLAPYGILLNSPDVKPANCRVQHG
jgi:hypothetical protein